MTGKELFKKHKKSIIWFGDCEETSDISGVIVGYNERCVILAVCHGEGDYLLKDSDIIPNKSDLGNSKGYVENDLGAIEFY